MLYYIYIQFIVYTDEDTKNNTTSNEEVAPKENHTQTKRSDCNLKTGEDNHRKPFRSQRYFRGITDPDLLCGVIFVDKAFTAKVLCYLLNVCL